MRLHELTHHREPDPPTRSPASPGRERTGRARVADPRRGSPGAYDREFVISSTTGWASPLGSSSIHHGPADRFPVATGDRDSQAARDVHTRRTAPGKRHDLAPGTSSRGMGWLGTIGPTEEGPRSLALPPKERTLIP